MLLMIERCQIDALNVLCQLCAHLFMRDTMHKQLTRPRSIKTQIELGVGRVFVRNARRAHM